MKNISILGVSGSIGSQTLSVIRNHLDKYTLVAFSVYSKIDIIEDLLNEFKEVKLVGVKSLDEVNQLVNKYPQVTFVEGNFGLNEVASYPCDLVINALVGFVGLLPTISAIKAKNDVALANKETLVAAGEIVMNLAKENDVKIIPIDSEHSAIFQCLEKENEVNKIILTASGGPFFKKSEEELKHVTLKQALNHPTWKMGNKITIDSATMFNKAFEIIEAHHLFNLDASQIDVIIHPQSIVHSLVEFKDYSLKAHLAISDMKIPIAYAMSYPNRLDNISKPLKLDEVANLEFYKLDDEVFKPIKLAYKAIKEKGTYPCVLNAANEEAVNLFLNEKIKFHEIYEIVNKTLLAHKNDTNITLKKVVDADLWAREFVRGNY